MGGNRREQGIQMYLVIDVRINVAARQGRVHVPHNPS